MRKLDLATITKNEQLYPLIAQLENELPTTIHVKKYPDGWFAGNAEYGGRPESYGRTDAFEFCGCDAA